MQLSITAKRMDKWTIAVRPVEARREDSLPGRGEKKVRVTTREIGRERERAWPIWTRELVCHLTSPRPRRLVSRFAQSDIRFVQ